MPPAVKDELQRVRGRGLGLATRFSTADQNDRGHNMPPCQEIRLMVWFASIAL